MLVANEYPTNFKAADEDGRVEFIHVSIEEARKLVDEISDDVLNVVLDTVQGARSQDGKKHYVILAVGG